MTRQSQTSNRALRVRAPRPPERLVRIEGLLPGMVLAEDVRTVAGSLVVSAGFEVTDSFVDRVLSARPGTLPTIVKVEPTV